MKKLTGIILASALVFGSLFTACPQPEAVTPEPETPAVTKVELTKGDSVKTSYTVGDTFDKTGFTVKAFYGDSDTEGKVVTKGVKFSVKDGETEFTFAAPAESKTLSVTATVDGVTSDAVEITVTVAAAEEEDPNLITEVEFKKAYLAPGWSAILDNVETLDATNGKVVIDEENNVSYTLPAGLVDTWQAQLLLGTDASVEEDDYWLFSCKLSGVTGGYTIKLNNDESLIKQQTGTIASAEDGVTVVFGGKAGADKTNIPVMFDFGTCSEGTAVISDLRLELLEPGYDVTAISLSASATSISATDTVTFTVLDQYGISVDNAEFSITTADAAATITDNVLTPGNKAETVTVKAKVGTLEKTIDITISLAKDYGKYYKAGSQTSEKDLTVAGYMALWYVGDVSWNCGTVVTVSDVTASETSYTITRTDVGSNTWSTQMFYKESAGTYNVSFKITSTVAGDITINNENISLTADTAYEYSKENISLEAFATLLSIQLGGTAGILPAGTFTISDFSVTKAE